MASYLSPEPKDILQFIANHVEYTLARSAYNIDTFGVFQATSYSIRDRLIEFWNDTHQHFRLAKTKMVYYFSIEYLLGRHLQNAITNLNIGGPYGEAMRDIGFKLEDLYDKEVDPGLGNGGLGRLAACFLDSLATMDYPAWGYGLRYNYGMFKQRIHDGEQIETPDYWLSNGNPWEIERNDILFPVQFYGETRSYRTDQNEMKVKWQGGVTLFAKAYDTPIPGYSTFNTINLRLWSSVPSPDLGSSFFQGHYAAALREKQECENLTSVLYPNDSTPEGRELKFKQHYFFSAATIADIIARFKRRFPDQSLKNFSDYNAIQLNDTHPTISLAEMMRVLMDIEGFSWEEAEEIVFKTFAYTNHTIIPECMDEWALDMFSNLLPRHFEIIDQINRRFLDGPVMRKWPGDQTIRSKLSIIQYEDDEHSPKVRMTNLACVCCHSINGVAAVHTCILEKTLLKGFYELWPEKFKSVTNGVTPRRWVMQCNIPLSDLITKQLGSDDWVTDFILTKKLRDVAEDKDFQREFRACKQSAKEKLRKFLKEHCDIEVSTNALFDVQVKRIHEYKRQLLNILGIISRYLQLKDMTPEQRSSKAIVPRLCIFAGKAQPSYLAAKNVIKLICAAANVINSDDTIHNLLKIVFIEDYNVSLAELLVPAADLSQHISTAGYEASGTSNMKFGMNGCLLLGTPDGATIEICEQIGEQNMFKFGLTAQEVPLARSKTPFKPDKRLTSVIQSIRDNRWASEDKTRKNFLPLIESIERGEDYYLISADFQAYMDVHDRIDQVWRDKKKNGQRCASIQLQEWENLVVIDQSKNMQQRFGTSNLVGFLKQRILRITDDEINRCWFSFFFILYCFLLKMY